MDHNPPLDIAPFCKLQSSTFKYLNWSSTFILPWIFMNWSQLIFSQNSLIFHSGGEKVKYYNNKRLLFLYKAIKEGHLTLRHSSEVAYRTSEMKRLVIYVSELKKLISLWPAFLLCFLLSLPPLCLFAFCCLERVLFSFVIQICGRIVQQQKERWVIGQ